MTSFRPQSSYLFCGSFKAGIVFHGNFWWLIYSQRRNLCYLIFYLVSIIQIFLLWGFFNLAYQKLKNLIASVSLSVFSSPWQKNKMFEDFFIFLIGTPKLMPFFNWRIFYERIRLLKMEACLLISLTKPALDNRYDEHCVIFLSNSSNFLFPKDKGRSELGNEKLNCFSLLPSTTLLYIMMSKYSVLQWG